MLVENNYTLYNNDCIEVMEKMIEKGIKVDLVLTDPPYDIKNTKTGGNSDLNKTFQKCQDQIKEKGLDKGIDYERILPLLWNIQGKKKNIYIWCNKAQIPMYLDYFVNEKNCSFDIIKWVKTNPVPNYYNKYTTDTEYLLYFRKGGYCKPENSEDASTLYQSPLNLKDKKKYGHPTIKPIEILERVIRNSSKPGDTIFDGFMGSGSTGVAANNLGRKFIGVELDKEFYELSEKRIKGEI